MAIVESYLVGRVELGQMEEFEDGYIRRLERLTQRSSDYTPRRRFRVVDRQGIRHAVCHLRPMNVDWDDGFNAPAVEDLSDELVPATQACADLERLSDELADEADELLARVTHLSRIYESV